MTSSTTPTPQQRNILFIHGFASAGFGAKPTALHKKFGAACVLSPNFPIDTQAAIAQLVFLSPLLRQNNSLVVGSSLGGFYAAWLSYTFGLQAVLINPALEAHILLREYHNQNIKNFKTNEEYFFSDKDTEALQKLYIPPWQLADAKQRLYFFLDKEDELLDSLQTAHLYKDFALTLYEGGNHSFAHMQELTDELTTKNIFV